MVRFSREARSVRFDVRSASFSSPSPLVHGTAKSGCSCLAYLPLGAKPPAQILRRTPRSLPLPLPTGANKRFTAGDDSRALPLDFFFSFLPSFFFQTRVKRRKIGETVAGDPTELLRGDNGKRNITVTAEALP